MIVDPATINWKRPDYDAICQRRLEVIEQLNADPKMLAAFKAHYRERPWDFMGDWGVTFDPRNQERGLPGIIPFVLFEKQISWVQWVMAHWRAQKSGLTEKSRDAGVSYLAIGLSCTLCMFEEGIAIGFGSRKEEYVDKLDEPKSLFWKARLFMEHVPHVFRGDWVSWRDAPHMRIKFPATGSIISGEAGDQIGRGDRRSLEFVDESAHLERPKLVDFSLSQTTNCRIDVSSVNGMNNPFAQKRHGTRPPDEMGAAEWEVWRDAVDDGAVEYPPNPPFVFVFDWRDDPRKDDEWYRKQQTELDPVVVAQEIDRDYQASVTGVVIPGPWVRAAIGALAKLGLEATGAKGVSLDVADEGVDKNAMCFSHGVSIEATAEWSGKGADIFDTVQRTFRACDTYGVDEFDYDSDGLGAGVRGDARAINDQRKARRQHVVAARGWRGSEAVVDPDGIVEGTKGREGDKGRTNKDYFANRKSQGWWALRTRFQKTYRWVVEQIPCNPDDIISINPACPNHQALVTELSQPTYKTNGVGKILIDKAPDGMKSPNKADAAMIRFAPKDPKPVVFTGKMVREIAMAGRGAGMGERRAALIRRARGY